MGQVELSTLQCSFTIAKFYTWTSGYTYTYTGYNTNNTNWGTVQDLMRHLQPDASNFGNWMNLIVKGAIESGEFTSTVAGFIYGISPVVVSSNGTPFKSIVLLLISPPCGVKWYSSRVSSSFVDFDPIHENVDFSRWMNETFLSFTVCKFIFRMLWTLSLNSVWLLRLIRSNVMPACNKKI